MPVRLIFFTLLFGAWCCPGGLPAQSVADLERQLQEATDSVQRWELNYRLSRSLFTIDLTRAGLYAEKALQLALTLKDKKREAESAWACADVAERQAARGLALEYYQKRTMHSSCRPSRIWHCRPPKKCMNCMPDRTTFGKHTNGADDACRFYRKNQGR